MNRDQFEVFLERIDFKVLPIGKIKKVQFVIPTLGGISKNN